MSDLSLVCIAVGVLVIVARGPLIFAPAGTLRFYRKLMSTNPRVRVLGLVVGAAGLALIMYVGDARGAARILYYLGWLLALVALVFMLVIPSLYRRMATGVLDFVADMDSSVPRVAGMLGVLIGILVIYIGLSLP